MGHCAKEWWPVISSWLDRIILLDTNELAVRFRNGFCCRYVGTTQYDYQVLKASARPGHEVWVYLPYHHPYVIIADPSGVAMCLEVKDVAGAFDQTDVKVLQFDTADGFSLTNVGGGVCRIDFSVSVTTQMSITSDASGLKLVNDVASPGNNFFYGTNASGVKGWYAQPGVGAQNTLTPNTGTTTAAYVTVFTLTNGSGLQGTLGFGSATNGSQFRVTYTDVFGNTQNEVFSVSAGNSTSRSLTGGVPLPGLSYPLTSVQVEVQDMFAGSHAAYTVYRSIVA